MQASNSGCSALASLQGRPAANSSHAGARQNARLRVAAPVVTGAEKLREVPPSDGRRGFLRFRLYQTEVAFLEEGLEFMVEQLGIEPTQRTLGELL